MRAQIFGVRHLSPAAAFHAEAFLNELQPTAVLIEGPSDMTALIPHISKAKTKPPIALLAYTTELPIQTILYPLAEYSPEYRAILWAAEHDVHVEFIDLPSTISLAIKQEQFSEEDGETGCRYPVYEEIARLSGEPDYDTYWERTFEQIGYMEGFRASIHAFSSQLRLLEDETDSMAEKKYNLLREAYMKMQIDRVVKKGHSPDQIAVITGAFHVDGLLGETRKIDIGTLPEVHVHHTLMPYSYYKLSTQSGYGAGNHAPSYFGMIWDSLQNGTVDALPSRYLASVAAELRKSGTFRSTAEVMDGIRLAKALASFKAGRPVLRDLRDAATVNLGQGGFSIIADACAKVEVGTAIGEVAEGALQTPVQLDFSRRLKKLKLEKFKSSSAASLQLDLRENRRVKSREAAFLDRERSFFFHQLATLGVRFAIQPGIQQEQAAWAEHWILQWTPEMEIQLVESTLLGETIELAVAFLLKEKLNAAKNAAEASRIVRTSYLCGMIGMMEEATTVVSRLGTDSDDFVQTSDAAADLGRVISYGDVRGLDSSSLLPLVKRLFLRGTLLLSNASGCSDDAAGLVMNAIREMNELALEFYDHIDEELWIDQLMDVCSRDDRNPMLSGYCCGLLLEKNKIDSVYLETEVSRRLSPGIPADLGAGWFEGLCAQNKYALLSRTFLWEKVDDYISTLTDDEFVRSLVFLRRSLSHFNSSDRSRIAEILAFSWGMDELQISEYLNDELTKEEESVLENLNEFDFGDL